MERYFYSYYTNHFLAVKKKVKFTIKANRHHSTWLPEVILRDRIEGTITFVGDFSYANYDGDTHKIIGFSDNWHHHQDSIRLGWRFNPYVKKVQIMIIAYLNGDRHIKHLCYLDLEKTKTHSFIVSKNEEFYFVHFNNEFEIISRTSRWYGPRYILFPYFGGQSTSEKEITFIIDRK